MFLLMLVVPPAMVSACQASSARAGLTSVSSAAPVWVKNSGWVSR
jgi:hypothetical protein